MTLHVHCSVLDELKRSQKNDIDKLAEIIKIWKITHSSSVTWETMINALEDPKFKNKYIADKIRQHLKLSKLLLLSIEVVLLILSLSIYRIIQPFCVIKFYNYYSVVEMFDKVFY